jgi:hypothetical protein
MRDETGNQAYTADRDLYLDRSGQVVEASDPTRSTLLARAGQTVPRARADELNLDALAPATAADDEAEEDTDETPKARAKPAATKARTKAPATKALKK